VIGRNTDNFIDRDVFCRNCTYNLRGLLRVGLCPECGVQIVDSLAIDGHAAQERAWDCGCAILAFGGWSLVVLALRLLLAGAGHLSILIGPIGLMVDLAVIAVGVRACRVGRRSRVVMASMIVAAVTLVLCAVGAYVQLWTAIG
jgi:hypothetical protein